jgi:hypothetical protein
MQDPFLKSGATVAAPPRVSFSGGSLMKPANTTLTGPQQPQQSTWQRLQSGLGGISMPTFANPGQTAASMLGGSAAETDWDKLFNFQGYGQSAIQNLLKQLNLSRPQNLMGSRNMYTSDWMKQSGLA